MEPRGEYQDLGVWVQEGEKYPHMSVSIYIHVCVIQVNLDGNANCTT